MTAGFHGLSWSILFVLVLVTTHFLPLYLFVKMILKCSHSYTGTELSWVVLVGHSLKLLNKTIMHMQLFWTMRRSCYTPLDCRRNKERAIQGKTDLII
jgi:hypothetical protein